MAYQNITMAPFAGLNEDENPASLQPGQLREATNVVRRGQTLGTRPGLMYDADSDFLDAVAPGAPVQGIFEFRQNQDTARSLVAVIGGGVYFDDTSGALIKVGVTISNNQNYFWTFASYQEKLFAAGGTTGDDIWYWDGSAGSISRLNLGFDCRYIFTKWNFLFLGGLNGSTASDNPMIARYCDYATDATVPANWKASNTIPGQLLGENYGAGTYGDEFNTGFGSYQDNRGDFLLFLTNRRIATFRTNPNVTSNADAFILTDSIANGCVGQDAFVDLGFDQGDAVYMSESGIHSMALSQQFGNRLTSFLSWPIRKTWETINRSRIKYAKAAYWPIEGLVLFFVSTGSSTFNNLCLCMDIKDAAQISPDTVKWYKWNLTGIEPNVVRPARDTDGKPYIYIGGTAGQVVRFDRTTYSDLGSAFPVSFRTKDEDYGAPASEKGIGYTFVAAQGTGTYQVQHQYILDDGNRSGTSSTIPFTASGFTLGTSLLGTGSLGQGGSTIRERIRGAGSAFTISHKFSHTGNNEPFWIGQIAQEISRKGISDEAA